MNLLRGLNERVGEMVLSGAEKLFYPAALVVAGDVAYEVGANLSTPDLIRSLGVFAVGCITMYEAAVARTDSDTN